MHINIKKIRDEAHVPTKGSEYSAGSDLYACLNDGLSEVSISPGETVMIPTGLSMEIPEGYAGLIFARSGLASKKGVAPANKVGVVDAEYRGEGLVALHNHSNQVQSISNGERMAQLVITPFLCAEFIEVSSLSDTHRGTGGFGSTGKI